jgi:hypothetical protein
MQITDIDYFAATAPIDAVRAIAMSLPKVSTATRDFNGRYAVVQDLPEDRNEQARFVYALRMVEAREKVLKGTKYDLTKN